MSSNYPSITFFCPQLIHRNVCESHWNCADRLCGISPLVGRANYTYTQVCGIIASSISPSSKVYYPGKSHFWNKRTLAAKSFYVWRFSGVWAGHISLVLFKHAIFGMYSGARNYTGCRDYCESDLCFGTLWTWMWYTISKLQILGRTLTPFGVRFCHS